MSNVLEGVIKYANLIFGVFWVIIVFVILIIGKRTNKYKRVQLFKREMIGVWKCSLVVAVVSFICRTIYTYQIRGSENFFYLKDILPPIFLFCQCLIGFAIAKGIKGYEPLPVTKAFIEHKHQWRKLISMLIIGLLITIVILVLDQFVPTFGEVNNTSNAIEMLPKNKWLLFFTLLYGAGIAEETMCRLIFLSLFWKLTNKKWFAIILSALLFGLYHLTPLNSMYKVYWGFPISQFVTATIGGIVYGYIYTKRGYETAVIGHTFSDWLPILIFIR